MLTTLIIQNICWLYISMADPNLMHIRYCIEDFIHHILKLFFRFKLYLTQFRIIKPLHYEKSLTKVSSDVNRFVLYYAWMIEHFYCIVYVFHHQKMLVFTSGLLYCISSTAIFFHTFINNSTCSFSYLFLKLILIKE